MVASFIHPWMATSLAFWVPIAHLEGSNTGPRSMHIDESAGCTLQKFESWVRCYKPICSWSWTPRTVVKLSPSKKGENNKAGVSSHSTGFLCILRRNIGWPRKTINMDNMGPLPSGRICNPQCRSNCYFLGDSNNRTLRHGCFQKYIVVPQNGWWKWWKTHENPIKMDDLGVPLFLETPIISMSKKCYLTHLGRRMKHSHQMTKENCSTLGPNSMAAALGRAWLH